MRIKYLSDTDQDYKYLEYYISSGSLGEMSELWLIQAEKENTQFIESLKSSFESHWPRELIEKYTSETYGSVIELPTRYDSIIQYKILSGLVGKIIGSIGSLELEHNGFPKYATLPTGEVNACAIDLPGSSKDFLLFDSQLFNYCHLFSKAFSLCLPLRVQTDEQVQLSVDINEVIDHVNNNKNSCKSKMHDLLYSFCIEGRPGNAKQYLPPTGYITFIDLIRDGMELMIVGHEFGHYFSGHLQSNIKQALTKAEQEGSISKEHLEEHEADYWGAVLSMHALNEKGYDAALAYIGVDLFFSAMILSARFSSLMSGLKDEHFKEKESLTHPSFSSRQIFLRRAILEVEGINIHADHIKNLYLFYDKCIGFLWSELVKANKRVN